MVTLSFFEGVARLAVPPVLPFVHSSRVESVRCQRLLTIMEAQLHIPIYTSMTQLLANLGSIADHAYVPVMHCLQPVSFDLAILARGGIDYPRSLSVGSVGNHPISSVHPAASSMVTVLRPTPRTWPLGIL